MSTSTATIDRSAPHRRYPVRVTEDVGVLRRAVAALAARLPGLPAGDAELVVTELATNILRHTSGGYLLCRVTADGGIELVAVDHGPAHRAPSGGLGVGLAAVRRRASTFDRHTTRQGTVVLARLTPTRVTEEASWRWGAVTVPRGGAEDSGDAWAVAIDPSAGSRLAALIVDGLGHGPEAAEAAQAAITVFERRARELSGTQLVDLTQQAHQALQCTRGGVFGVCVIDPDLDRVTYLGVGNTTGRVLAGPRGHHLIGQHGTLGTRFVPPVPKPTSYVWPAGATLVLATDGVDAHWDMTNRRELLSHHPVVVAATLHRDHSRGTDDAAVLVVSDTRASGPS